MRTLTTTAIAISLIGLSSAANALTFVAGDSSPETQLCMSIATDNTMSFYLNRKDLGLSERSVTKMLSCNNMSAKNFANFAGAERIESRLNRYDKTSVTVTDIAKTDDNTVFIVTAN